MTPARLRCGRRAAAAALVAAVAAATAAAGAPPPGPRAASTPWDVARAAADHAGVERILRASGVERQAPRPSLAEYAGHAAERLAEWLAGSFAGLASAMRASGLELRVVAVAATAAMFVAVLWLAVGALVRRGAVRRPAPAVVTRPAAEERAARLADRQEWLREVERRLARGEAAAALEALWWWLARSLSGAAAEGSWTSRELLARAGRLDLAPLASSLDGMIYGSARPGVEDVRRLSGRMQAALP